MKLDLYHLRYQRSNDLYQLFIYAESERIASEEKARLLEAKRAEEVSFAALPGGYTAQPPYGSVRTLTPTIRHDSSLFVLLA